MKVLFYFTQQIAYEAGGVERVVSALYHSLSMKGYEITTVYLKGLPYKSPNLIPNQIKLPNEQGNSVQNRDFIVNLINKEHFNIALNFAAIFNKSSRSFVDGCIETNLPVISVYHNTLDWPLWANSKIKQAMRYPILRKGIYCLYKIIQRNKILKNANYISRHSEACIVLGNSYIAQFENYINEQHKHLQAIYNPLTIPPETTTGLDDKENVVLFLGRLDQQKNLPGLLRIWQKTALRDWKLEIVGSGPDESQLKNYAQSLGIPLSVFKGKTSEPEKYYRRAKIFAMTSTYEGFPMTLIECQAYGCVPIIFDSFPAASEIVNDTNGILVDNNDEENFCKQLSVLMEDPDRLRRLSLNAIEWARQFDLEIISNEWDKLIQMYALKTE